MHSLKLNPLTQVKQQKQINDDQNLLNLLSPPPIVFIKKPPHNPPAHHLYLTQESVPVQIKKIIIQVEEYMDKGEIVQATQLLRKGKQITKHNKDKLYNSVIYANLAICYYKIGLLQQAFQELWLAEMGFKQAANIKKINTPSNFAGLNNQYYNTLVQRIKLKRLRGKISLQICILFSELGNHDLAMKHSKIGCRIHFNLIYDTLILLYGIILKHLSDHKYSKILKSQQQQQLNQNIIYLPEEFDRVVNLISIMNHLLEITKDVKLELLSKYKQHILNMQMETLQKYGKLNLDINLDLFMTQIIDYTWITKNKILNQVQMECIKRQDYLQTNTIDIQNNQILEQITYLAVSFYCISTEARFMEKNSNTKNHSEILDSEHWLSKSLQLAYCFLPPQAPILGQIYSVHNKFHGIDKQAIPQDKQMQGYVKILKPLRRPKSTYTKSSLCAPILIRIQTPKTLASQQTKIQSTFSINKKTGPSGNSFTIQLDTGLKKNNKVKQIGVPKKLQFLSSLQKIYKNQINRAGTVIPRIDQVKKQNSLSIQKRNFTPIQKNSRQPIQENKRPHSNQHLKLFKKKELQSETIDIMETDQNRPKKNSKYKNVDIQINNNINLFITNQIGKIQDNQNPLTTEYNKGLKKDINNRKMIVKLIQSNPNNKQVSKRSLYYGKKKGSNPLVQETTNFLPQF